jgi:hypothetical protein
MRLNSSFEGVEQMGKCVRVARLLCGLFSVGLVAGMLPAAAVEPGIAVELGQEHLQIPETRFGIVKWNFIGGGGTIRTLENSDGEFDGTRLDLSIGSNPLSIGGKPMVLGVKGFFSWLDTGRNTQDCTTPALGGAIPFCTVLPLFDPNPAVFNTPFDTPLETITYRTVRDVTHWGIAFELSDLLRGKSTASSGAALKAGLAYRRLGQDTSITAVSDAGAPIRDVNYQEQLDTDYWGAYAGATGRWHLGTGLFFTLDGEVGLYQAKTEYHGSYLSRSNNPGANNLSQTLSLDHDAAAVIASLKLALDQDFGAFSLGAFVRGEVTSYAPKMAYNEVDQAGGAGLVGDNNGTGIDRGKAWSVTAGARLTVPFTN